MAFSSFCMFLPSWGNQVFYIPLDYLMEAGGVSTVKESISEKTGEEYKAFCR